ncbi:MAG: hypothetical protein QNK37_13150 [Acidobacteriota bacterium]|nr:hypothetical protein [Acidobacteriota bacterium]
MLDQTISYPIDQIDLIPRACDPAEPLGPGDSRYADWDELRQGIGSGDLIQDMMRTNGAFHQGCLCGHRGCGKSTELLRLKDWADKNGFLAVRAEVDVHFGLIDLQFSDLFLLAGTAVEEAMAAFDKPLPQKLLGDVVSWFADIIREDKDVTGSELKTEATAQLGGNLFGLAKLLAKFTAGVKAGSEHVLKVRSRIQNYPDSLIHLTNNLLDAANKALEESGRERGLLLIFDNLDRFNPDCIDKVLFRSAELIRKLRSHAVFSIPIGLELDPLSGPIQDHYGFSVVLPMLALRQAHHPWDENVAASRYRDDAVELVRKGLAKRIDLGALFESIEDVDLLIKYSGGCIRDLMHLLKMSYRYNTGPKIDHRAVTRAVQSMQAAYVRRLQKRDYEGLARVAVEKTKLHDDVDRFLYHRYALEYQGTDGIPWLDVHPLIVEIKEFRNALDTE